jgi:orotate phosphoribosyltransferase-like protein
MLTVEKIGRIGREHFIKGKTIKEIARELKVSRNTVRKVLRSGATSFEYERDVRAGFGEVRHLQQRRGACG